MTFSIEPLPLRSCTIQTNLIFPFQKPSFPSDSIHLSIFLQELCVFQIIAFQAVVNRRMSRLIFQMRVCARIKEDFQILTFLLCRKPNIRHTLQRRSKPFRSIIAINLARPNTGKYRSHFPKGLHKRGLLAVCYGRIREQMFFISMQSSTNGQIMGSGWLACLITWNLSMIV